MKKPARLLSLLLAFVMLATFAFPASAFEGLGEITNVTDYGESSSSSSEEQVPPDQPPGDEDSSSSSSSEDESSSDPDSDNSGTSSSRPDDEAGEPPIVDSGDPPAPSEGEPLPGDAAQAPVDDLTVGSSGLSPPPEGVISFEAAGGMMYRIARANGTITIQMVADKSITHRYPFSGGNITQYAYIFTTSDGQAVYCVEPARFNSNNGTVVTGSSTFSGLSTAQQKEIAKAIAANPSGAGNHASYFACQAIIWEIAYGQSARSGSVYDAVIKANIDKLGSAYESIRAKMNEGGEIPSFMNPDPEDPQKHDLTENGGTWSADLKNTNSKVTLRASDFKSRAMLEGHPKATANPHYRERIRATIYEHKGQYIPCGEHCYQLNYKVA